MIDIMIVDDERLIREGIKNGINWEAHGINVCATAGSASEALTLIDMYMPNIIITDIRMPDMDGLELLENINRQYSNIKVILISGYKDFEYAQTAISLDAFCYILKPIDSDELLAKVLGAKAMIEEQLKSIKLNEDIKKRLEENMWVIRDNFLIRMVKGELSGESEIQEMKEFLDLNSEGVQFCVAILEIETPNKKCHSKWEDKQEWHDEGWYKAAVMNEIEVVFKDFYRSYSFNFNNSIGLLISGQQIDEDHVKEQFVTIKEWVNNSLGLSMTVGIGNTYNSMEEVPISCREAMEASEYKVVMGKNVIIPAKTINTKVSEKVAITNFENILKNSEDDLVYSLKAGDKKAVNQIVDDIIVVTEQVIKANIRTKEHLMLLLAFFLLKIVFSLEIHVHQLVGDQKDLYIALKGLQTIEELQSFLCDFFHKVIQELDNRVKSQNGFLVKQAVDYINANIYNDISLIKVAEYLGVHPNYLSRIFSQELGESFIEYSIKVRMNEAKLLLRNSTNKVYEIADSLHYKDVSHFARVFKKTYGVSPSEYRQLL